MQLDPEPRPSIQHRLSGHFRRTFITGLLALIPLALTYLILRWLFDTIDGAVQPVIERSFDREITGAGIGLVIVFIYVIGIVVTNFLGRGLLRYGESMIMRVPIVRWFYHTTKSIIDSLSAVGHTRFRVVLVQWPTKGIYTIGFLTGTIRGKDGGPDYFSILIPTTPTPQTGLLAIVPQDEVTETDLSVEDGIRLVVSSGVLAPKDLMKYATQEAADKPIDISLDDDDKSEGVDEPVSATPKP
ncbi:MAG: DUF502 domain-containing protein [Chloroflexi bacterium]|nr:DUF502 domain-containing protein [Chloroflexota bacterium]